MYLYRWENFNNKFAIIILKPLFFFIIIILHNPFVNLRLSQESGYDGHPQLPRIIFSQHVLRISIYPSRIS